MDWLKLAKILRGLHTVETIQNVLKINRKTAVNYVYELRKRGFVETERGKNRVRRYRIRLLKDIERGGNLGLYETLNKYGRIQLWEPYKERIYDHKLSIEETIVGCVKTKRIRVILASLALFNKVRDWKKLREYAEKEKVGRKVGALYDVAKTKLKVRKMDKRIRKSLLKSKVDSKYMVDLFKSKNFQEIEKEWRVFIPLNRADLGAYDEW